MKKIILILCATLSMSVYAFDPTISREKEIEQEKTYNCPMHPEVTSHKKESCHICGMFLEEDINDKHELIKVNKI